MCLHHVMDPLQDVEAVFGLHHFQLLHLLVPFQWHSKLQNLSISLQHLVFGRDQVKSDIQTIFKMLHSLANCQPFCLQVS